MGQLTVHSTDEIKSFFSETGSFLYIYILVNTVQVKLLDIIAPLLENHLIYLVFSNYKFNYLTRIKFLDYLS